MSNKSKKKQQAARAAAHHKSLPPSVKNGSLHKVSPNKDVVANPLVGGNGDDADDTDIPPEDLQIAIEVLEALSSQPELLTKREYKPLKRAGWEFGKVLSTLGSGSSSTTTISTTNTSIQSQISHLLSLSLYRPALVLLFDIHTTLSLSPTTATHGRPSTKLGSLQRWVRDCDATARPGEILTQEEKEERRMVLRCLDMVLRVCSSGPGGGVGASGGRPGGKGKSKTDWLDWEEAECGEQQDEGEEEEYGEGVVRRMKVWDAREDTRSRGRIQREEGLWKLVQKGHEDNHTGHTPVEGIYTIQVTPGHLRRPPNLHSSTVHASAPNDCPLNFPPRSSSSPSPEIFSLTHPHIPTCSLILNVLPPSLCQRIVQTCNALSWDPDQAIGGSAVDKTSVLAHNVVWLAGEDFVRELFERIRGFVPDRVGGGGEKGDGSGGRVRGINRRFRVYRYGPKQVYRPHIDGAWPAAGIDEETGEYLHDSSPADDPLWSRYTILIYLNADINPSNSVRPSVPGATTFFLPHPHSIGTLASFPIAPVQGAVLVFPHGDARGSLLHEGSPVGEGGWKVVIRTDLLYEAEGFGEFARAKRMGGADAGGGKRKGVAVEEGGEGLPGDGPEGNGVPSMLTK